MKTKWIVGILIFFVLIFFIYWWFNYKQAGLSSNSILSENKISSYISLQKIKNDKNKSIESNEKIIIKGALPPSLEKINNELNKMDESIFKTELALEKKATDILKNTDIDDLIIQTDKYIAKINQEHGIDGIAIENERQKIIQKAILTSTPQSKQLEKKITKINKDLSEMEEKLNIITN